MHPSLSLPSARSVPTGEERAVSSMSLAALMNRNRSARRGGRRAWRAGGRNFKGLPELQDLRCSRASLRSWVSRSDCSRAPWVEWTSSRIAPEAEAQRQLRINRTLKVTPSGRAPRWRRSSRLGILPASRAGVAKLADARDSKSREAQTSCGFDPRLRHCLFDSCGPAHAGPRTSSGAALPRARDVECLAYRRTIIFSDCSRWPAWIRQR